MGEIKIRKSNLSFLPVSYHSKPVIKAIDRMKVPKIAGMVANSSPPL